MFGRAVTEFSGEGGAEGEGVGVADLVGDGRVGVAEEVGSEAEQSRQPAVSCGRIMSMHLYFL